MSFALKSSLLLALTSLFLNSVTLPDFIQNQGQGSENFFELANTAKSLKRISLYRGLCDPGESQ